MKPAAKILAELKKTDPNAKYNPATQTVDFAGGIDC